MLARVAAYVVRATNEVRVDQRATYVASRTFRGYLKKDVYSTAARCACHRGQEHYGLATSVLSQSVLRPRPLAGWWLGGPIDRARFTLPRRTDGMY